MMRKSSELGVPEVFLSSREIARQVSIWRARGLVRKIAPRLYTTNLEEAPETLIRRHLLPVLSLLFPNTVLSHRSALEAKASPEGTITLTGSYPRIVRLPGVTVRIVAGPGPLEGDTPLLGIMRACAWYSPLIAKSPSSTDISTVPLTIVWMSADVCDDKSLAIAVDKAVAKQGVPDIVVRWRCV